MMIRITGGMLRAGRSLVGLSQQEIANRAGISRPSLTTWEGSSGSIPNANARALDRVVSALEAEGVRFAVDGVFLQRPAPMTSTIVQSEALA